jgi:hypothetical protein
MLSEKGTKELYESYKRLRIKHLHLKDDYWQGALKACEEILEIKITDR